MRISARILARILLAFVFLLVIEELSHSEKVFAFWQWVLLAWRAIWEFIIRALAWFSKSIAAWTSRIYERLLFRRLVRPAWQIIYSLIAAVLYFRYGKWQVLRRIVPMRKRQRYIGQKCVAVWNYEPDLSLGVRAAIALAIILVTILLFLYINEEYGENRGLAFSLFATYLLYKLPALGFDSMLYYCTERWQPIRWWALDFKRKHARLYWWLSWFWLGPVVTWIKRGINSLLTHATRRRVRVKN